MWPIVSFYVRTRVGTCKISLFICVMLVNVVVCLWFGVCRVNLEMTYNARLLVAGMTASHQ
jgi:hypothetical protein